MPRMISKAKKPKKSPLKKSKKSKSSKSPVRIPIKGKNDLSKYGYAISKSPVARHRSLTKAVKEYGPLSVFRKLNAVSIFNKNRNPKSASKFIADRNWVKEKFMWK